MKKYLTLLAIAFSGIALAQQISLNSQYIFNETMVNPGATGAKDYIPVHFNFRKQWSNFPGAPTTQYLSVHAPIARKMGLGGALFNDVTGPSRRTGMNINSAYHLQLDKNNYHRLGMGIGITLSQHIIDMTQLTTYQPNDPAIQRGFENKMVPDANIGFFYRYKDKGFAGISAYNLVQFNRDLYKFDNTFGNPLVRNYYVLGGYNFTLSKDFGLKTSALARIIETGTCQIDGTVIGTYRNMLWLGVTYRHNDAVAFLIGAQVGPFKFGYSYDYTLSDIAKYSSGSHEVFLELQLARKGADKRTPWLKRNRVYNLGL